MPVTWPVRRNWPGAGRGRRQRFVPSRGGELDLPYGSGARNRFDLFRPEGAAAESAVFLTPRLDLDLRFWVGAAERPEFLRQTRLIAEVWGEGGARVRDHYDPGHNHFTVVGELARPRSDLVRVLVGQG